MPIPRFIKRGAEEEEGSMEVDKMLPVSIVENEEEEGEGEGREEDIPVDIDIDGITFFR